MQYTLEDLKELQQEYAELCDTDRDETYASQRTLFLGYTTLFFEWLEQRERP